MATSSLESTVCPPIASQEIRRNFIKTLYVEQISCMEGRESLYERLDEMTNEIENVKIITVVNVTVSTGEDRGTYGIERTIIYQTRNE